MAGLAEATRVFGNLSREVTVRDFLAKHKGQLMLQTKAECII